MKKCTKCKVDKCSKEFHKDKTRSDGLFPQCRECKLEHERSEYGLISRIYYNQKKSSKKRGYAFPEFSKEQLIDWVRSQPNFPEMFRDWVSSDYHTDLTPSLDREDDYKPYTLNSISLTTWGDHNKKSYRDVREGKNNKRSKSVISINRHGERTEYYSIMEASRRTGAGQSHITSVCKGKRKFAGKLQWEYKKQ